MKRSLLFAFVLLMSMTSAFAQEKVVDHVVYFDRAEIPLKAKDIKITDLRIVDVPKKTKYFDIDCTDTYYHCTDRVVLEKEKVLQITVSYDNGELFSENELLSTHLNFTLDSLVSQDLAVVEELSKGWDIRGRKAKARIELAKKNFNLNVITEAKMVKVIDYNNSTLCDGEIWCREKIQYTTAERKFKKVVISLK